MKKESIVRFFEDLSAPMRNYRTSWGAVRSDGVVFLRGWEDQIYHEPEGELISVDGLEYEVQEKKTKAGRTERRKHLDLVRGGATCYVVVARAVDVEANPRVTESFNDRELLVADRVIDKPGVGAFLRISGRVTPMSVRLKHHG